MRRMDYQAYFDGAYPVALRDLCESGIASNRARRLLRQCQHRFFLRATSTRVDGKQASGCYVCGATRRGLNYYTFVEAVVEAGVLYHAAVCDECRASAEARELPIWNLVTQTATGRGHEGRELSDELMARLHFGPKGGRA